MMLQAENTIFTIVVIGYFVLTALNFAFVIGKKGTCWRKQRFSCRRDSAAYGGTGAARDRAGHWPG